jgi:ion channel-forming bestrophin family protein
MQQYISNYLSSVKLSALAQHPESKSFIASAFAWQGSVTPRVLPRVFVGTIYAAIVCLIEVWFPIVLPITPFEYSGAILALVLVLRVNAGHDRWWEARKLWGGIVNQSRNLALVVRGYSEKNDVLVSSVLVWIAAWPHVIRESLRRENSLQEVTCLLGEEEANNIRSAEHMPTYVAFRIALLLAALKKQGFDSFAFHRAETERSQLIDGIGACERIRNTQMPFVLAIKTRRFILLFLLLLPLALVDRVGWVTPLVVALASYPLFSLDEIGAELQNPFSAKNLSHLPLDEICKTITGNVLGLLKAPL